MHYYNLLKLGLSAVQGRQFTPSICKKVSSTNISFIYRWYQ